MPATSAVRPVRPPASTPEVDSTKVVMVVLPVSAPMHVPMASTEEGALNAGQIAVFIEHIGTVGNGEHRAERGKEITEEAHKYEDQAARGEYALEIEVEHDVAEVAEIRHGRDAIERRHAERDADERGGDDADEDRAFDVQGVEHDDEQQSANGQQHGGDRPRLPRAMPFSNEPMPQFWKPR